MTDTQPLAPTDAEIFVVAREAGLLPDNSHPAPETRAARKHSHAVQAFARAVLAKWGTPPAVAVPLTDEQVESLLYKYGYDPDDEHMAAMLKEANGINGGQHGTE